MESEPRSHNQRATEPLNTLPAKERACYNTFPRTPWKSLTQSGCVYPHTHVGHSCCVPRNTGSGRSVLRRGQRSHESRSQENVLISEGWGTAFAFPALSPRAGGVCSREEKLPALNMSPLGQRESPSYPCACPGGSVCPSSCLAQKAPLAKSNVF